MTLANSIDFLAGNCPTVFKPIAEELERLSEEKERMQNLLDLILTGGM